LLGGVKGKLGKLVREQEKAVEEKKQETGEKTRIYDWIDHSEIGVIEKETRDSEGNVAEYVIRHPMGNLLSYPKAQVSVADGKHFLYPYSVSSAIQLAEALKTTLSRCEELVRLHSKMNIDEETYRENMKKIVDQERIFDRYTKTVKDLDSFGKRLDREIEKMLAEVHEARSSNIFGDLADEEFRKKRDVVREKAQAIGAIRKFVDTLRDQISTNYDNLAELVHVLKKEEEAKPGEAAPKRRVFHLDTSAK